MAPGRAVGDWLYIIKELLQKDSGLQRDPWSPHAREWRARAEALLAASPEAKEYHKLWSHAEGRRYETPPPPLDPSLAAVLCVIDADLVGEVHDDLAISDQQEVFVGREGLHHMTEEGAQMFVTPAVTLRVLLCRRVPRGPMTAGDAGLDAMAQRGLRAPLQDPGRAR